MFYAMALRYGINNIKFGVLKMNGCYGKTLTYYLGI